MLLVGAGGFVGSVARFTLSGFVQRMAPASSFPFGTLAVNVAGCLAIGFLGGMLEIRQMLTPTTRLFVMIGLLGGFTTFSTFAYETLGLAHGAELGRALLNAVAQLVLGLGAAWLGYVGAQSL
jgi:CrcB protein